MGNNSGWHTCQWPDDTFATAYEFDPAIDGNTYSSYRSFHGVNDSEDEYDTIKVTIDETRTPIWVETMYVSGFSDTYLYLYDSEENLLKSADDNDFWGSGYSDSLFYVAPAPGTYYIQVYGRGHLCEYELHITIGDARRVWGENRFATAAEVSRLQWDDTGNPAPGTGNGPEDIVIANGTDPADALAGGAFASRLGGVLLLTRSDSLPWETWYEIERITESNFWDEEEITIWVLGGESVVSREVFEELGRIENISRIHRVYGVDRAETAARIATATAGEVGGSPWAFVVNGHAWADGLTAAPVAAYANAPVLLTHKDHLPQATMDWLMGNGITNVVVVGGEGVVSAAVFDELDAEFTVERVSGVNRYETARAIALWGVSRMGMDGRLATLVSGENFPDALAAAPISWWTGGPVLLTPMNSLHPEVITYFEASGLVGTEAGDGTGCYLIGGAGAVSESVYEQFRDLWRMIQPSPSA